MRSIVARGVNFAMVVAYMISAEQRAMETVPSVDIPHSNRLHLRSPCSSIFRVIGLILRAPSWTSSFVSKAGFRKKVSAIWNKFSMWKRTQKS